MILSYLIAPTTVYNKISAQNVSAFIDSLPQQPSQYFNTTPLHLLEENKGMETTHGLWRNLSMFHKRPANNGCNPLRFTSHDEAMSNGHIENVLQHPILYVENHSNMIINSTIARNSFCVDYQNRTDQPQVLVLNQNYHHLWKAYLNEDELHVMRVNKMVMGVILPENSEETIVFKFESPNTKTSALIALIAYLGCLFYLIFRKRFFN